MPFKQMPKFNAIPTKMLEIPQPGIGGLNLFDLEYEQEVNQSPYMLNMMYRNGTFSKRYGQEKTNEYDDEIYSAEYFDNKLIVHAGDSFYIDSVKYIFDEGIPALPEERGMFIKFYQTLYYKVGVDIYEYKFNEDLEVFDWEWKLIEPYIPESFLGCAPVIDRYDTFQALKQAHSSGSENDLYAVGTKDYTYYTWSPVSSEWIETTDYARGDDINILINKYKCVYDGVENRPYYMPYGNEEDIVDWSVDSTTQKHKIKVYVDDNDTPLTEGTEYTVDDEKQYIKFTSGHVPARGYSNVTIEFTIKPEKLFEDQGRLLNCKYYINYGANGNTHLFLGGGGDGKMYYSDSYDATYFPENNWLIIGSTEKDITGFGLQYNVLIVFKPTEIYSVYSYQITASMVTQEREDLIGREAFGANIVNAGMGCDAPYSIQLINNQITWYSSRDGVCVLVSTNVSDERNVRVISRNINHKNNFGVNGILDYNEDLKKIQSYDYDYKYFLVFPESGYCYMWDYAIAPFTYSSSKATDPRTLDWYIFNNFYVRQFIKIGNDLEYIPTGNKLQDGDNYFVKLNNTFIDLDYNHDDEPDGIDAYYMTPFYQFGAVEYLKNVHKIYVQCRGDTASKIDMYYYTENNSIAHPEEEPESIIIGGRLWAHFQWSNFQWLVINWANTFMRKCSLKKIQMASFLFKNNEAYRDMSISHIGLQYSVVKPIK